MNNQDRERYLSIVEEQERLLVVPEDFSYDDALRLGALVVDIAKEKYRPIAVRIDLSDITVFYHLMDGTSLDNDWWMKKKLNGCRKTGRSSMWNFLSIRAAGNEAAHPWVKNAGSFAAVGGSFLLATASGDALGWVIVSGLSQEEDHQLAAEALARLLGREIPTILDGGFSA